MPKDAGLGPLTLASLCAQLMRNPEEEEGEGRRVLSGNCFLPAPSQKLQKAPLHHPPTKYSEVTSPKVLHVSFIKFF